MREFFRGALLIFAFKLAGAASTLLSNLVISHRYGVEVLGVYNLILTLIMFLSIFNRVGLDLYVIRKIPELESDGDAVRGLIRRSLAIVLAASGLVGLALVLGAPWIDARLFPEVDARGYLRVLALVLALYSLLMLLSSIYRGYSELLRFSFFQNLYVQGAYLAVLAVCTFGFAADVDPVHLLFGVIALGAALSCASVLRLLRLRCGAGLFAPLPRPYTGPVLREAYPLSITSTSIFIISYLNTFFVSYFHGVAEVGVYAAIMRLSIPLVFFSTSVSNYLAPRIARGFVAGDLAGLRRQYRGAVRTLVLLGAPVVLVLCLFPGFFLGLFGEEFRDASVAFIVYNLSVFAGASLFGPIGYLLAMTDNQRVFQRIMLAALVFSVLLNLWLIPAHGILGAAISTLLATLAWKAAGYVVLRRKGLI